MADHPAEPPQEGLSHQAPAPAGGRLLNLAFVVGSVALLAVMATDFVGVICRHLGVAFVGAIEIIQACIVFTIASALVAATLTRGHATVHLLTERMSQTWQERLARVSDALSFLAFSGIAAGNLWLLYDTRGWDERSDLLGLPILPLRVVWTASLVLVSLLFLGRVARRTRAAAEGRAQP